MYTALMAEVAAEKIPVRIVDSSMRPLILGGASVRCLGPAPNETATRDNDLSMVLRIARGPQGVMFTGDIEAAGERALLRPRAGRRTRGNGAQGAASRQSHVVFRRVRCGGAAADRPALAGLSQPIRLSSARGRRPLCGGRCSRVQNRPQRRGERGLRPNSRLGSTAAHAYNSEPQ
jgi:hypothetical protein